MNAVIIVTFSWKCQMSSATFDEYYVIVTWRVAWETLCYRQNCHCWWMY